MLHQEITAHFHRLARADIAEHSRRFFKTAKGEYGYGDKFMGIRVPEIRKLVKQYHAISLDDTETLLASSHHEIRLFALLSLVSHFSKSTEDVRKSIYRLYLKNTRYINNWDLVDCSAHYIVGAHLEHKDRKTLYTLSGSNSLWERRIAIIATYWFVKRNQFTDTLNISKRLLGDTEDLIHKAVGWMLREVGKRDVEIEKIFLNAHCRTMPRTMLRYAIEKFDKTARQNYLSGNVPS